MYMFLAAFHHNFFILPLITLFGYNYTRNIKKLDKEYLDNLLPKWSKVVTIKIA